MALIIIIVFVFICIYLGLTLDWELREMEDEHNYSSEYLRERRFRKYGIK